MKIILLPLLLISSIILSSFSLASAQETEQIGASMWLPKRAKVGMTGQLENLFLSGILAKKNDAQLLRQGAITTMNKLDTYFWQTDVGTIVANAPRFRTPGYPEHKDQKLDAMGRYQMCNAVFTIVLPPNHQPSTTDLHFAFAVGTISSTLAIFYLQTTRDQPMSTFEAYAVSEPMNVLIQRMQREKEVLTTFLEDCTSAMQPIEAGIE